MPVFAKFSYAHEAMPRREPALRVRDVNVGLSREARAIQIAHAGRRDGGLFTFLCY